MITDFDINKLNYYLFRCDNGSYFARFTYPDDNGDILSVDFEFNDSFYQENSGACSYFTDDTFVPNYSVLHFVDSHTKTFPSLYYLDLPTTYGYRSKRGKWLRSGSHHTCLHIDFEKLFAF